MAYLRSTGLNKVSYPSGRVVQMKSTASGTRVTTTHSSWTEPSTAYRVAITPKFADSTIIINYFVPINQTSATNIICLFRAFRLISGGSKTYSIDSYGASNSNRNVIAGGSMRPVGYDAQDPQRLAWIATDTPSTLLEVSYGFETYPQSTNTTGFGQSVGDSSIWGFDTDIVLTASEVAQP